MKAKALHFPAPWAVAAGIAAAIAFLFLVFGFSVVEGSSMEPLLTQGLVLVILRPAYLLSAPRRGDVVVFRSPADGRTVVKRCAALPGDRVEPIDGGLLVAGRLVPLEPSQAFHFGSAVVVPPGRFFALGDNPRASVDSRDYGPVPFSALRGRVIGASR